VPVAEEIKRTVNATESIRNRALILFLKDSGLRESDVAKLKWRDLRDYGEGYRGFVLETKKGKIKARGFIGPEATEVLRIYKNKRIEGTKKLAPEDNIQDHPVFASIEQPEKRMKPITMSVMLGRAIKLAGVEDCTPHGFRKFWEQNTHFEKEAYAKQMNGRALDDVERSYFWKEIPELLEMYKANYRNLKIEKQEFRETEERLRREYERELESRDREIEELKRRLDRYTLSESQVAELLRRIEKLEKQAQKRT